MKVSELRKLIREEITKVLSEVKKVKVEIGPFEKSDTSINAKLEIIVKSFVKNAKQKKGAHDTYWLTGIFDKNAFDNTKEKYSLTLEKGQGSFTIKYKNNDLVLRPDAFLSDKELENLVGLNKVELNIERPFSKQVEAALVDHINHYESYKKLDTLLKSNKIPKKYLTYSGTVYRLVTLKDSKSLQSYLSSPKSIKSTSNSIGISSAKSIDGINAYIENAMNMDGIKAGLIFQTKVKPSDVLLDIDNMINDLFDYEDEMGIESNIAYEGEEEVILKSPMTFSPDMLVATVTDSKIKKIKKSY